MRYTGYEDYYNELEKISLNKEKLTKEEVIDKIFNIYRSVNIFPMPYFDDAGIKSELLKHYNTRFGLIKNDELILKSKVGGTMLASIFQNLYRTKSGAKDLSLWDVFHNDKSLKTAIIYGLGHNDNNFRVVKPFELIRCLKMHKTGHTAINFNSGRAKIIYEHFCPKNGTIYDFSCGFGGRMLGALSSSNNYTYIGVDPNKETFDNLHRLGEYIKLTKPNKKLLSQINSIHKDRYFLFNQGSENFNYGNETIDFSFSSPPYFDLEKYTDDINQCYNKYSNIDDWINFYVKPTIHNIYLMHKHNTYHTVNIADFTKGKETIPLVDIWKNSAIECGFDYIKTISMPIEVKATDKKTKDKKQEGIYVFFKK